MGTSEVNNLCCMSLDILLKKYKELFGKKLGLYKYEIIDPNCKLIFCKPKPILFHLRNL